jgi:molecular chaperone DnaK (HSP70)
MPKFISKITGEEITANGQKRNITSQFLVDDSGNILHDKSREEDAEGVARRIEVESFKVAIRKGIAIRKLDENGKMKYEKLFWEEFPGTMDQAEEELKDEIKMRAEIDKEYREKLKKVGAKKEK